MSYAAVDPAVLAAALIQCPSVTPNDCGALDILQERLAGLGFQIERPRFGAIDNLFAWIGEGHPHFCFAGHSDVVPAGDPADWSTPPFAGTITNDLLIGRGAADMKGAIAAFVAAASHYLATGKPAGIISLMITGDEEGAAIDGTAKLLPWLETRGQLPTHALVGEPTSQNLVGDTLKIGRRGSFTGHLTVTGKAGHVAYPRQADNPIPRLLGLIAALGHGAIDSGTAHFAPSNLEWTTIDIGNSASNVIPARANARFNIRFNDRYNAETLEQLVHKKLAQSGFAYQLEISCSGDAFLTDPAGWPTRVAEIIEQTLGHHPVFSTGGGTSDARFIHHYCPVVELGLIGATMHQTDEAVALNDLTQLTRLYQAILQDYFAHG